MSRETESESDLMERLRQGLPLVRRPFAEVGSEFGIGEARVIEQVQCRHGRGEMHAIEAVFDLRRLGYTSVLCATGSCPEEIEELAEEIAAHRAVTHCYERTPGLLLPRFSGPAGASELPNLWFMLCAPGERFDAELDLLRDALAPRRMLVLPAVRRFKIGDGDAATRRTLREEEVPALRSEGPGDARWDGVARRFSEDEKALVRALQDGIPLVSEPFAAVSAAAGWQPEPALRLLRRWQESGVLRRVVPAQARSRAGATGMCAWRLPEERVIETGRALAERPEVSHCYQRVGTAAFPLDLYAMIRGNSAEDACALFENISGDLGLDDGLMLISRRQYKRVAPRLFDEEQGE